jgi:hypothetical protein
VEEVEEEEFKDAAEEKDGAEEIDGVGGPKKGR